MSFAKLRQAGRPAVKQRPAPGTRVSATVKVREAGYRPEKLRVRADIGPLIFTADFLSDDLEEIERDPRVEVVALAEVMPLQKLP